jgi:hypothetical protein
MSDLEILWRSKVMVGLFKNLSTTQSYNRKVEETKVNTVPPFNYPNYYGRHIKIRR